MDSSCNYYSNSTRSGGAKVTVVMEAATIDDIAEADEAIEWEVEDAIRGGKQPNPA